MEVIQHPPYINDVITVKNYSKSFDKKLVHNNVSFSVRNGECLGLLGGSGSGKSVILRSLIGLERPDAGQILIENEDISDLSEFDLFRIRKRVAYVFQNGALFDSMTVFENIAYPLQEHTILSKSEIKNKVTNLLTNFNLSGAENLMPNELSGGMLKRVGIARAIALQPHVVLYDEPTAGLDPANTKTICDLILKLKGEGSSSILVTHDIESALAVCDRICFLKNGAMLDLGSPENIKKNKNIFMKLFFDNGESI